MPVPWLTSAKEHIEQLLATERTYLIAIRAVLSLPSCSNVPWLMLTAPE